MPDEPKPVDQPKPGEGDGGDGGDEFDRGKLHPILRDMSPEQINDLMETMSQGLRAAGAAVREPKAEELPTPKEEAIDVRDLMNPQSQNYDPEKALGHVLRKNYSGVARDVSSRSLRALVGTFRTEFEDFKDYEKDILGAVEKMDPTTVTDAQVLGLYFQAKGLKQTQTERADKAKKAGATTHQPSPPKTEVKPAELTDVEVEVANRMFRRAADPLAEYRKYLEKINSPMEMRVPTGRNEKGEVVYG